MELINRLNLNNSSYLLKNKKEASYGKKKLYQN